MKQEHNILTDLLRELKVPFTEEYSSSRFETMPFKSLFGLQKLLQDYKIESKGFRLGTPGEMLRIPVPYIAKSPGGVIIVTDYNTDSQQISYLTNGVKESISAEEFIKIMPGIVFVAFPSSESCEPDYVTHKRGLLISLAKKYLLSLLGIFLFLYLWIDNGLYRHVSMYLVMLFDLAGLYFSTLLLQKSLRIHNPAADRVCKVIQDGGCDNVLKTKASSFFGIFSWSEVGFTYFSVSLACLLLFPHNVGYLALCNLLCLPFSFWSVWYQKNRAKSWCTLCLCVQATLWLLFICYLSGGCYRFIFPLRIELIVLIVSYAATLLAVNKIASKYENSEK